MNICGINAQVSCEDWTPHCKGQHIHPTGKLRKSPAFVPGSWMGIPVARACLRDPESIQTFYLFMSLKKYFHFVFQENRFPLLKVSWNTNPYYKVHLRGLDTGIRLVVGLGKVKEQPW